MVSKFLLKCGNENLNSPIPPVGWTLEHSRKKVDSKRLKLHSIKNNLKNVYLESELPNLHAVITSLPNFDIHNVNMFIDFTNYDPFICDVEKGWYLPVMYKRQKQPFFSMIFKSDNHTKEEEEQFVKYLRDQSIQAVFYDVRSKRPFFWGCCTTFKRWEDSRSITPRFTIG